MTTLALAVPQISLDLGALEFDMSHLSSLCWDLQPNCVQNVTTVAAAVPEMWLVHTKM